MVLRKGLVGFWVVGALGATILSGCSTLNVHEGYKTAEETGAAGETASPDVQDGLLTSIVSTNGGGTHVVFPIDSPPSNEAPAGPADRVEVYGTEFYRADGDNHEVRTNIANAHHSGGHEGEGGHEEGGHEGTGHEDHDGAGHEGGVESPGGTAQPEGAPANVPQEGVALPEGTGAH